LFRPLIQTDAGMTVLVTLRQISSPHGTFPVRGVLILQMASVISRFSSLSGMPSKGIFAPDYPFRPGLFICGGRA
jgi:hypothetical protein